MGLFRHWAHNEQMFGSYLWVAVMSNGASMCMVATGNCFGLDIYLVREASKQLPTIKYSGIWKHKLMSVMLDLDADQLLYYIVDTPGKPSVLHSRELASLAN